MTITGVTVTSDDGVSRIDDAQDCDGAEIVGETVVLQGSSARLKATSAAGLVIRRAHIRLNSDVSSGFDADAPITYGERADTIAKVEIRDNSLVLFAPLTGRKNLLLSAVVDSAVIESGDTKQSYVYTQRGAVLQNCVFRGIGVLEVYAPPSIASNVTVENAEDGYMSWEAERLDWQGFAVKNISGSHAVLGRGNANNVVYHWNNDLSFDNTRINFHLDTHKYWEGHTWSPRFEDLDTGDRVGDVLVVWDSDLSGSRQEVARYLTNSDGRLTGTYNSQMQNDEADAYRPTMFVLTKVSDQAGSSHSSGGGLSYDLAAIANFVEVRSYLHEAPDGYSASDSFAISGSRGSLSADYSVDEFESFYLRADAVLTEHDKDVVLAYTEIDTAAKFYDRAKAEWRDNDGFPLVERNDDVINVGDFNVVVDATAADAFAFDGETITIKATEFVGGLTSAREISAVNGASINGAVEDANGVGVVFTHGMNFSIVVRRMDTGEFFPFQQDVDSYSVKVPKGTELRYASWCSLCQPGYSTYDTSDGGAVIDIVLFTETNADVNLNVSGILANIDVAFDFSVPAAPRYNLTFNSALDANLEQVKAVIHYLQGREQSLRALIYALGVASVHIQADNIRLSSPTTYLLRGVSLDVNDRVILRAFFDVERAEEINPDYELAPSTNGIYVVTSLVQTAVDYPSMGKAVWEAETRELTQPSTLSTEEQNQLSDIKAVTDQFTFADGDVNATLGDEQVTTDADSREASKADVASLATAANVTESQVTLEEAIAALPVPLTAEETTEAVGGGMQFNDAGAVIATLNGEEVTTDADSRASVVVPTTAQIVDAILDAAYGVRTDGSPLGAGTLGEHLFQFYPPEIVRQLLETTLDGTTSPTRYQPLAGAYGANSLGAALQAIASKMEGADYVVPPTAIQNVAALLNAVLADYTDDGSVGERLNASATTENVTTAQTSIEQAINDLPAPLTTDETSASVLNAAIADYSTVGSVGQALNSVRSATAVARTVIPVQFRGSNTSTEPLINDDTGTQIYGTVGTGFIASTYDEIRIGFSVTGLEHEVLSIETVDDITRVSMSASRIEEGTDELYPRLILMVDLGHSDNPRVIAVEGISGASFLNVRDQLTAAVDNITVGTLADKTLPAGHNGIIGLELFYITTPVYGTPRQFTVGLGAITVSENDVETQRFEDIFAGSKTGAQETNEIGEHFGKRMKLVDGAWEFGNKLESGTVVFDVGSGSGYEQSETYRRQYLVEVNDEGVVSYVRQPTSNSAVLAAWAVEFVRYNELNSTPSKSEVAQEVWNHENALKVINSNDIIESNVKAINTQTQKNN